MAHRIALSYTHTLPTSIQSEKLIKIQHVNSHCKNWSCYSTKGVTTVWIPVWHCSGHIWRSVFFNLQEFIFHTKDSMHRHWNGQKYRVLMTELVTHITVVNSWEWLSIWRRFSAGFSETNVYNLQPLYSRPQKQLGQCLGINTIIFVVLFN